MIEARPVEADEIEAIEWSSLTLRSPFGRRQ
jgi:hypothetical protein